MAVTVDELQVLITAQTNRFNSEIEKVQKNISDLSLRTEKSSSNMTKSLLGFAAKFVSIGAIIKATTSSINSAMEYIEDENLFAVSMGKWSDSVRSWSEEVQKSVGVSSAWLRKYSGVMTNMTASMGIAKEDAVQLGKGISLLSNDLASFYNISAESAFEKIQSAMAGMPRPLQELGIMVRDAEVTQTAYNHGLARTGDELNTQQKALATYIAILERTNNAQGDLARTINSPANQMRMLKTSIVDLGVAIGTLFQPLLSAVLPVVNAIVIAVTRAFQAIARLFGIELETSSYTDGLEDVSSGISGIGDSADKAASSAKKLAKQLAGFDEMNTLEDKSASTGSGGGGASVGSIAIPNIDWDSLYNGSLSKATNAALELADKFYKKIQKIGDRLQKTIDKIDWSKIQNGLEKLYEAVKPFGDRIGIGLAWFYDNVIEPLVVWAANDVIPAALKLIAGAINLLGAIIDAVSPTLASIFEIFLAPIAEFTGGIIVAVLEGIGNMLQWISEQRAVVDLIINIATAIGIMVVAWQGYQLVAGIVTGIQLAMNGAMIAGTTASGAFATGLGLVTAAQGACATAGQLLNAVFSSTTIIGLGITAVLTGINVINEAIKLSTMEAELAERQRMDTVKLSTQTTNWHNEALQRQKEILDELENAELNAVDSELAYINAQESATQKRAKYNEMLNSGKYSTEELHKAELEALSAEGRATAAKQKLAEAQQVVTDKTTEYENQEWKRIMTEKQAELIDQVKAGRYKDVSKALEDLSTSTLEYKDANGKTCKFAEEDVKNMALFIGDQLAKADSSYKTYWESTSASIEGTVQVCREKNNEFVQSGKNFASGIANGINSNQGLITNAAKNSANAAKNAFNSGLQIHSPSRVMMKSGGFFVQGVAEGIMDSIKESQDAAKQMAELTQKSVADNFGQDDLVMSIIPSLDRFVNSSSTFWSTKNNYEPKDFQRADDKEAINLTVKIGEETLVDKIINAINEKSFMNNMGVINV